MAETIVVPASLLPHIKEGLITMGYADESTPLHSIQDLYYKFVMVRQTGKLTNIPYSLESLPIELQGTIVVV